MDKDKDLYNPDWDEHGYIQVYTGDGKGKTTASLGLAMRALGRDWKVLLIMFTKGGNKYGELNSFRNLSEKISKKQCSCLFYPPHDFFVLCGVSRRLFLSAKWCILVCCKNATWLQGIFHTFASE